MKKRSRLILTALSLMMAVSAAIPAAAESADTIKIGVLLPYSGGSAKNGELESLGIELYTELFNENGGVQSLGGAKIELVKADSTSVAEVGATEFQKLVEVEKHCTQSSLDRVFLGVGSKHLGD